jgi:hypothetical protein
MDISKLDIDQLVKYINLELKKNSDLSVNKLCDKLEIKRSTFKTKVQKEHYSFNADTRRYEKSEVAADIDISMKEVIKSDDTDKNKDTPTNDGNMTTVIDKANDKDMTKVIPNNNDDVMFSHQIKNNLIELAKNYDKIMSLINSDKGMNDGITIELPVETLDNFRTTIRVNNVAWGNFKEFCVENKMFTQRDLLSMALTEYMNKYNKK